ncbi:hypothetical protein FNV62_54935 [Streptomyces sp. RLB3-17]|nr:hypothetical protein FNV62_54935 [Streptomyces sp. RLB3-17]
MRRRSGGRGLRERTGLRSAAAWSGSRGARRGSGRARWSRDSGCARRLRHRQQDHPGHDQDHSDDQQQARRTRRGVCHSSRAPPAYPAIALTASRRTTVPGRAALTICPLPR